VFALSGFAAGAMHFAGTAGWYVPLLLAAAVFGVTAIAVKLGGDQW
jgi:hypothetical protein